MCSRVFSALLLFSPQALASQSKSAQHIEDWDLEMRLCSGNEYGIRTSVKYGQSGTEEIFSQTTRIWHYPGGIRASTSFSNNSSGTNYDLKIPASGVPGSLLVDVWGDTLKPRSSRV